MHPILLIEGLRYFRRSLRVRFSGMKRYEGSHKQMLQSIIQDAWNPRGFLHVSSGNFASFFCRDFGMISKSLVELGYKQKVHQTLDYVLTTFKNQGHVKTIITKWGISVDFPTYAPDSLAFLLHALAMLGEKKLVTKHKKYLNEEIEYFKTYVLDVHGVRKNRHFSSMKDYAIRSASCYDVCMAFMVQKYAKKLGLSGALDQYDFKLIIMKHYWKENYFLDDLSGRTYLAGDAQTLPFWSGLITDKSMFKKVQKRIKETGLDRPLALRYTLQKKVGHDETLISLLNSDYESNGIWVHLGLLWMEVLERFDKKDLMGHIDGYRLMIAKHRNFLELYNDDLSIFTSPFYIADESMTWMAMFVNMEETLRKGR